MKPAFALTLLSCLVVSGCATVAPPAGAQAEGVRHEGSLANAKLIRDAMVGVVAKAATLGCARVDDYEAYVVQMPRGEPGARVWRERWVLVCSGRPYPIGIRFSEDGLDAADWAIE